MSEETFDSVDVTTKYAIVLDGDRNRVIIPATCVKYFVKRAKKL